MSPTPEAEPADKPGDRLLRLFDLAPYEVIVVICDCGWSTEYGRGFLQRNHRVPSDTLVYDLQYRLRCKHCNRTAGFEISILDDRNRGDKSKPRAERVIVPRGE